MVQRLRRCALLTADRGICKCEEFETALGVGQRAPTRARLAAPMHHGQCAAASPMFTLVALEARTCSRTSHDVCLHRQVGLALYTKPRCEITHTIEVPTGQQRQHASYERADTSDGGAMMQKLGGEPP